MKGHHSVPLVRQLKDTHTLRNNWSINTYERQNKYHKKVPGKAKIFNCTLVLLGTFFTIYSQMLCRKMTPSCPDFELKNVQCFRTEERVTQCGWEDVSNAEGDVDTARETV